MTIKNQRRVDPQVFGTESRGLVETAVKTAAGTKKQKVMTSNFYIGMYSNRDPNVQLAFDNIQQVVEGRRRTDTRRNVPIADIYADAEAWAREAAAAAARTTGGQLTPESARFLPFELQDDYAKLTGLKISSRAGSAMPGVTIEESTKRTRLTIDFAQALAGQTAQKLVLGLTRHAAIIAERVEPPQDASIPPYRLYLSPREGKVPAGTDLRDVNGTRSFTSSDSGHLIGPDTQPLELRRNDRLVHTLEVNVDRVNDWRTDDEPAPSEASRAAREAWLPFFSEQDVGFNLRDSVASGRLQELDRRQFDALAGADPILRAIRSQREGSSVTRLVENGVLSFYRDTQSQTAVALLTIDGEDGQDLFVLDTQKRKWVGTWGVADDATRNWNERG